MKHKIVLENKYFKGFPKDITLLPSPYFKDSILKYNGSPDDYNVGCIASPLVFKHKDDYYSLFIGGILELSGYLKCKELYNFIKNKNLEEGVHTSYFYEMKDVVNLYEKEPRLKRSHINFDESQIRYLEIPNLDKRDILAIFKLKKAYDKDINDFILFPDLTNPDIHVHIVERDNYNVLNQIQYIQNKEVNFQKEYLDTNLLPHTSFQSDFITNKYLDEIELKVYHNNLYIGNLLASKLYSSSHLIDEKQYFTFEKYDTDIINMINPNLYNIDMPNKSILAQPYNILHIGKYTHKSLFNRYQYKTIEMIKDTYIGLYDLETILNPIYRNYRDDIILSNNIQLNNNPFQNKLLEVLIYYMSHSKDLIALPSNNIYSNYFPSSSYKDSLQFFMNATIDNKQSIYNNIVFPNNIDLDKKYFNSNFPYTISYLFGKTNFSQIFFIPKSMNRNSIFTSLSNPFDLL